MKYKNIALACQFITLEAVVIASINSAIKNEIWYFKGIFILMYTLFVWEMSCLLINIFCTQWVNHLKKEISTLFIFNNEKMGIKLSILIISLVVLIYSIYYDTAFIAFGTIIISGQFITNHAIIYIHKKQISYISSCSMKINKVTNINIENSEIKLTLDNKRNIVIKTKDQIELNRLLDMQCS